MDDSNPPRPQHTYSVYLAQDHRSSYYDVCVPDEPLVKVGRLAAAIKKDEFIGLKLGNESFILYKYSRPVEGQLADFFKTVKEWLHSDAPKEQMAHGRLLKKYFENGPAPSDAEVVDVVIAPDSFMESRDNVEEMPTSLDLSLRKAADVKGVKPPSESSNSPAAINSTIKNGHLRFHRPALNYGPHTSLFHHAFAKLKHRADRLDDDTAWQGDSEANASLLETCHDFMTNSCEVFEDEKQRTILVKPFFEKVLSERGREQTVLKEVGGRMLAKLDATWGATPPYIVFREDKNEKGMGGNSAVQGAIGYRVACSLEEYKQYMERSNCPAIIIAVMGTCIEIWTAVFIDGVFIDKVFSQEFYLDAFQAKSVLRLGRICSALKQCYDEVKQHYRSIDVHAAPTDEHQYPRPLPVEGSDPVPQLKYIGKLSHSGKCIPVVQEEDAEPEAVRERPYAIYRARLIEGDGEVDVVVKFATRYNDNAHRLLHGEGLAPPLRYFARLVGDFHMIVTDYVDSAPLSDCPKQENYLGILSQVKKAVELLHGKDLVFGDLRPENIVLDPQGGAKLIDFDFAGTHGIDRYPASFNTTFHPEGVYRHGIMDKRHDIAMLSKLQKFLEAENK